MLIKGERVKRVRWIRTKCNNGSSLGSQRTCTSRAIALISPHATEHSMHARTAKGELNPLSQRSCVLPVQTSHMLTDSPGTRGYAHTVHSSA